MSKLETNTIDTVSGTTNLTIGSTNTSTITMPNGKLSGQNFPAWFINLSADQTGVTDNVATKVQFNSVEIDTDNMYDNTTNYRITIPSGKAGKYYVQAQVFGNHGNSSNVNRILTYLQKNGGTFAFSFFDFRDNPIKKAGVVCSAIIDCAVGDYLEVLGFVDSVNNQDCEFLGDTVSRESWFQGYRLGA
jgi:hypothetical protein